MASATPATVVHVETQEPDTQPPTERPKDDDHTDTDKGTMHMSITQMNWMTGVKSQDSHFSDTHLTCMPFISPEKEEQVESGCRPNDTTKHQSPPPPPPPPPPPAAPTGGTPTVDTTNSTGSAQQTPTQDEGNNSE